MRAHLSIKNTFKGTGIGTNILDNYDYRDKSKDNNTKLLMGDYFKSVYIKSIINYYLSNKITLENTINILEIVDSATIRKK